MTNKKKLRKLARVQALKESLPSTYTQDERQQFITNIMFEMMTRDKDHLMTDEARVIIQDYIQNGQEYFNTIKLENNVYDMVFNLNNKRGELVQINFIVKSELRNNSV
jgi:hypothetical protein